MIVVEVSVECELWAALPNAENLAAQAIDKARRVTKIKLHKDAEVSVLLVDDARIRSLNAQWRNIDKATNVLSFPTSAPGKLASNPLLGDIVMAFETMQREARDEGKSLANHFSHLVCLFIYLFYCSLIYFPSCTLIFLSFLFLIFFLSYSYSVLQCLPLLLLIDAFSTLNIPSNSLQYIST